MNKKLIAILLSIMLMSASMLTACFGGDNGDGDSDAKAESISIANITVDVDQTKDIVVVFTPNVPELMLYSIPDTLQRNNLAISNGKVTGKIEGTVTTVKAESASGLITTFTVTVNETVFTPGADNNYIRNGGFEEGTLSYWSITDTHRGVKNQNTHSGTYALNLWYTAGETNDGDAFELELSQVVKNVPAGEWELAFYMYGALTVTVTISGLTEEPVVEEFEAPSAYELFLIPITVTESTGTPPSGKGTITFEIVGLEKSWGHMDDIAFVPAGTNVVEDDPLNLDNHPDATPTFTQTEFTALDIKGGTFATGDKISALGFAYSGDAKSIAFGFEEVNSVNKDGFKMWNANNKSGTIQFNISNITLTEPALKFTMEQQNITFEVAVNDATPVKIADKASGWVGASEYQVPFEADNGTAEVVISFETATNGGISIYGIALAEYVAPIIEEPTEGIIDNMSITEHTWTVDATSEGGVWENAGKIAASVWDGDGKTAVVKLSKTFTDLVDGEYTLTINYSLSKRVVVKMGESFDSLTTVLTDTEWGAGSGTTQGIAVTVVDGELTVCIELSFTAWGKISLADLALVPVVAE